MLKLILGPCGSGKTRRLFSGVVEDAAKFPKKNFIVVVPEQFSMVTTRQLVMLTPQMGIMNIDVLSFARFAHRIFDSSGSREKDMIDDTGKNLILHSVAAELSGELKVLSGGIKKQGFISEIKSIIAEFIQYEIAPSDVDEMAVSLESRPYLSSKLSDIALLYKAFRNRLQGDYITREELLDLAASCADSAEFLRGCDIVFDNFTGFTPIQYRFIEKLMEHAENVSFTLPYDGEDDRLFFLTKETIYHLERLSDRTGHKVETHRLYDNPNRRCAKYGDLDFLEKSLFRKKRSVYRGDVRHIESVLCDSPRSEVSFVCSEISKLAREGFRYSQIGVVMSDVSIYASLLEEEAARYEIPCFIDSTSGIRLNPFTEFVRSALSVETENFSYEAVFHFLRTAMTNFDANDIDLADNYVRSLGIRGRRKYRSEWTIRTRLIGEDELIRINALREGLVSSFAPLDAVMAKRGASAREYTEAIRKFIDEFEVQSRLEDYALDFKETGDGAMAAEYEQIYDKLSELFDRIADLLGDEKMTMAEYLELLNSGLDEIRIGIVPPGLDSLNAGDMTRSRFSDIKVLFFMGLNEGLIPIENSSSGILSDMDRELLKGRDVKLAPTSREKVLLEKLYFYMSLTKPSEKLCLTYSASDSSGSALRASWFLRIVRGMFPNMHESYIDKPQISKRLLTAHNALQLVSDELQGQMSETGAEAFRSLMGNDEHREHLRHLIDAAFTLHRTDPISKAAARAIYGSETISSPSRLEKFALCAYQHFLQYGLRLCEREEFGFERRDLGTVLHGVLELCCEILSEEGKTFADLDETSAESLTATALERFLSENENAALTSSNRYKYFTVRMARILLRTVRTLSYQAASGSFSSSAFEKSFNSDGFLGRIDRVDVAGDGKNVYVSVIDYKSGNKEFDLSRIYYGLDLQLVIYMNAAMQIERVSHKGKDIKPAGIFYYHIDDPTVNADDLLGASDQEIEQKLRSKLKLRGIVNSDPNVISLFDKNMTLKSDIIPVSFKVDGDFAKNSSVLSESGFSAIIEYVKKKSFEYRGRIESGEISKEPANFNGNSGCDWCSYRDVCLFDTTGKAVRARNLPKLEDDEAIERMK